MFAQLSATDPVHLRDFLIIVGFLLSAAASFGAFLTSRKSQKREVTMGDEFVTKGMCVQSHEGLSGRISKLEQDLRDLRGEVKNDREIVGQKLINEISKVHDRINDVLEAVSELRGQVNAKVQC